MFSFGVKQQSLTINVEKKTYK